MFRKGLITFFALLCLAFAFEASAQLQNGDIVLEITPAYPKTNEQVYAAVSTYTTDLDNARISWMLNGEVVSEGIGKKNFSFKTGNSEFQMTLEVKIETISGSTIDKKIIIAPTDVDMLWEAYDSYVPPFYKGKTLVSTEGMVKIVAFPSTQNPAGFSYKWKLDGKLKPDSSGYEKNYFVYKNSYLEDSNSVEVAISDIFGSGIGQGTTTVKLGQPKVLFYQKDPILGTRWERALSNGFTLNTSGDTLVAEPYFLYPKNLTASNLTFDWFLNGEKVEAQIPINTLSVKTVSGQSGNATVKIIINNNKALFGEIQKQLNVSF